MTANEAIDAINAAANRAEAEEIRDRWVQAHRSQPQHHADWNRVCNAVIRRFGEAMLGPRSRVGKNDGD